MANNEQIAAVDAGTGPIEADQLVVERYEVQVKDAVTGEVLGYGGGDTPEQAFQRAMEDAQVSGEMMEPLETNNEGVRD